MPETDLLHVVRQHIAARDFHAAEGVASRRHVDPIAVVQVQYGAGRHHRALLPVRPWKVAVTNMPSRIIPGLAISSRTLAVRVLGSRIGPMLLMRPLKSLVRIGVQAHVGELAHMHAGQVVLVNVAQNPHAGKIRDGEQVGRIIQRLHARRVGHVLLHDHARDGRANIHHGRRIVEFRAQHLEVLLGGLDIHLGLLFGVLGHFEILGGDGPLVEQKLRAVQLGVRQLLVGHGVAVVGQRLGDIGALHPHEQLALGHFVAQLGAEIHHASRSQRDHRHVARHVGAHHAGDVQLRSGHPQFRVGDGELLRMGDGEDVLIAFVHHFGRRRRPRRGVGLRFGPAARQNRGHRHRHGGTTRQQESVFHWITSRPTAIFN